MICLVTYYGKTMLDRVDRIRQGWTAHLRAKNNEPIRSGADRCASRVVQRVMLVGCDW